MWRAPTLIQKIWLSTFSTFTVQPRLDGGKTCTLINRSLSDLWSYQIIQVVCTLLIWFLPFTSVHVERNWMFVKPERMQMCFLLMCIMWSRALSCKPKKISQKDVPDRRDVMLMGSKTKENSFTSRSCKEIQLIITTWLFPVIRSLWSCKQTFTIWMRTLGRLQTF